MRLSFFWALLLAVVVPGLLAPHASAGVRRYAVVVAYSGAANGDLAPLDYADDDGARYYELLSQLADDTSIYTVLDASTQQLFPSIAKLARLPRRADLLAGLSEVFKRIQRDAAAGQETVFYFVLVGHGRIGDGGEGSVALLDGSFSRTDMFQEVLAKSPATVNHVIVDACNAYYLVHRRGDGAEPAHKDAVTAFVGREDIARYPNTGFILSTSTEKDTHEWSVYRAGIFSHELHSAMIGGADVNGDGQIAYSEISAFVAAANQHVATEARVEPFVQPPAADLARPLVDLRASRFSHWLYVPKGNSAQLYLEDGRGVRYGDVHVGRDQAVTLGLLPSNHYFVRTADGSREIRFELGRPGRIELDRTKMKSATLAARGATEESFRLHLYEEPFDAAFYRGYVAAQGAPSVPLDALPWRPGPPDRELVDLQLRRLNGAAKTDGQLRRRLGDRSVEIARAIEKGDFQAGATLLREAETSR